MKAYELLFFVSPSLDEDSRAAAMKRIESTIAEGEGSIDNTEDWGKRKLAYEINGLSEADYTLIDFHADPASIAELDRVLRITDAVVRHMIIGRYDRD
ncbi:MAG: 30S ribosomal protein S6 [Eggerthellaceae bacterium]|jgi:small subunit ribosomal protein S6|nr:30S ribosomal protein S6 [Eggerthellaceae bacterium]MDR2716026.1 30S ribosomal protein S6 [Coriobacteriaceae bacterium]